MNLGISLASAKFLGSRDRVVAAGGCGDGSSSLQILYDDFVNGVDGARSPASKCDFVMKGTSTSLALCGIPRLMKTVAAVGGFYDQTGAGFVELVDVETKSTTASLRANSSYSSFLSSINGQLGGVTSVAFFSHRELLALGTEAGEVLLVDLHEGKELQRIVADHAGVNAVAFDSAGRLVTLGESSTEPGRLWDVRVNHKSQVLSLAQTYESKLSSTGSLNFSNSSGSSTYGESVLMTPRSPGTPTSRLGPASASLVSVACHPVHDKVYLGTSSGGILLWDLRSNSSVAYQSHSSRVTQVLVHPEDSSQVLSSSSDGTIQLTNTMRVPVSDHGADSQELFTSGLPLNSLDCDPDSQTLLTTSEHGNMFKFAF